MTSTTDSIREFCILSDFLAFLDPQIQPRDGLNDEVRELLARIARGEASDEDRTLAVPVLNASSEAMEFFARQLEAN